MHARIQGCLMMRVSFEHLAPQAAAPAPGPRPRRRGSSQEARTSREHKRLTGSCVSLGPFGLGAAISWLAFLVVPPAVSRPPSGRRRARRYDFLLLLSLQLTTSSSTQKPKAHCRGVARHTKWSRALQGHTHGCIPAPPDTSFCGTVMMHIKSEFATAPQSFR